MHHLLFENPPNCLFTLFILLSKQLELQFRSLGLSFMSKTAVSRDMQVDHIKGTINSDVRYMWPIKFMVGYLVLSDKCYGINILMSCIKYLQKWAYTRLHWGTYHETSDFVQVVVCGLRTTYMKDLWLSHPPHHACPLDLPNKICWSVTPELRHGVGHRPVPANSSNNDHSRPQSADVQSAFDTMVT